MKRNRSRKPAALFIFTIAFGCGKPAPRTPEELAKSDLYVTNIETAPIEYQLAFQDSGELPRGNDVNAARIRYL